MTSKEIIERMILRITHFIEEAIFLNHPFNITKYKNRLEEYQQVKQDLERLKVLEEENQELKNKYEKLKTKYSNIRKYPPINQALMNYDEIDWEILKDEYGEEVLENG